MWRDFTFIDDVIYSIMGIVKHPAIENEAFNKRNPDPYKLGTIEFLILVIVAQ